MAVTRDSRLVVQDVHVRDGLPARLHAGHLGHGRAYLLPDDPTPLRAKNYDLKSHGPMTIRKRWPARTISPRWTR
jgi:hypothetical protein